MNDIFQTKLVHSHQELMDVSFPKADIVVAVILEGFPDAALPLAGFWFPKGFKRQQNGSLFYEYKVTFGGKTPEAGWQEILSNEIKKVRGTSFLRGQDRVRNPAHFYEDFVLPALLEFVDEKRAQYAKLEVA